MAATARTDIVFDVSCTGIHYLPTIPTLKIIRVISLNQQFSLATQVFNVFSQTSNPYLVCNSCHKHKACISEEGGPFDHSLLKTEIMLKCVACNFD